MYQALSSRFSLSQGLSRVSLGLTSALKRLSLGPAVNERDSVAQVGHSALFMRPSTPFLSTDLVFRLCLGTATHAS